MDVLGFARRSASARPIHGGAPSREAIVGEGFVG